MTTREEHMKWCKGRALEYLPANPQEALTSMMSDLGNHDETKSHIGIQLMMRFMMAGSLDSPAEARKFINGFN